MQESEDLLLDPESVDELKNAILLLLAGGDATEEEAGNFMIMIDNLPTKEH